MNRYNQVSHLTRDTIWESDKTLGNITAVSPFTASDHKAEMNIKTRQYNNDKRKTLDTSTYEQPKRPKVWSCQEVFDAFHYLFNGQCINKISLKIL